MAERCVVDNHRSGEVVAAAFLVNYKTPIPWRVPVCEHHLSQVCIAALQLTRKAVSVTSPNFDVEE